MSLAKLVLGFVAISCMHAADVEWPVNGGTNNIRYSPLTQITRDNAGELKVAWTYDLQDAFKGSEMQSNPITSDRVVYSPTPRLRAVPLNAESGRENWSLHP